MLGLLALLLPLTSSGAHQADWHSDRHRYVMGPGPAWTCGEPGMDIGRPHEYVPDVGGTCFDDSHVTFGRMLRVEVYDHVSASVGFAVEAFAADGKRILYQQGCGSMPGFSGYRVLAQTPARVEVNILPGAACGVGLPDDSGPVEGGSVAPVYGKILVITR